MFLKTYLKHSRRNTIIGCAILGFLTPLIIIWAAGYPIWSTTALLITGIILVGCIAVGWLVDIFFTKVIYPQLGIDFKKPIIDLDNQISPVPVGDVKIGEMKMDVDFEIYANDIYNFYLFDYEKSPKSGKARKLVRHMLLFFIAAEILAAIIMATVLGNEYLFFTVAICVLAFLSLLYYFCFPLFIRNIIKAKVTRNFRPGSDLLTGKHKLTITPDTVTDMSDMGQLVTRWNAIEWIAATEQYFFIIARGSGPIIVPKRAFKDDISFRQFVDTAIAYYQATKS